MDMPDEIYHSALQPAIAAGHRDSFVMGESVAFVHDLVSGPLPQEYKRCDLVVTDLMWQPGQKKFHRRAGVDSTSRTYKDYMLKVCEALENRSWAAVMVTGVQSERYLPEFQAKIEIKLNGGMALAYCFADPRDGYQPDFSSGIDTRVMIREMAEEDRNQVVGDFCCGYGRTGRIFQALGKPWVMSDVNPTCIEVIAQYAPEWKNPGREG